jgi:hypothetical protein
MPRLTPSASPYDAQAAVENQLARLRASAGATRVSVWVHEASTEMAVPYRQSVAGSSDAAAEPHLRTAVILSRSPFLSAVIRSRRSSWHGRTDAGPPTRNSPSVASAPPTGSRSWWTAGSSAS